MVTSKEKGDALEAAVAAIEEEILKRSPASAAKPSVEKKKIIEVDGVRHEIDVYVTIDSAAGYKSIFIFECKNWQDAVGKNEIIVFSEKIDASQATGGYFVAKSFTSDAEAQAKKDARITLLLATDHDPSAQPYSVVLFAQIPKITNVNVKATVRGAKGLDTVKLEFEKAQATYLGESISLLENARTWCRKTCDEDVQKQSKEPMIVGIHERVIASEQLFQPNEFILNGQDIEKLTYNIEYKLTVWLPPIISHFEVHSRGRFFRFAPLTDGGATVQCVISFPGRSSS